MSLLAGFVGCRVLMMSPLWYIGAFVPLGLLKIHDYKNAPYSELENFYRYALDVKSAKERFNTQKDSIIKELKKIDAMKFNEISNQLKQSEITLYEVVNDLDKQYLEM